MSARRAISTAVLVLVVTLTAAPLFAQGRKDLEDLQDKTIELMRKVQKATVAIHCKLDGKRPTTPRLPVRGMRRRPGAGSYFGTGALISSDGYILTSTSVVPPKGKEIKVYFENGKVYDAKLVGFEERNNVTLIKIDATGLPTLKLGSSKNVKVGQVAFTFGNPYDCILNDHQVAISMGVVSGVYRLRGDGDYTGRVIETDAALNAGNDGGPLVNVRGEVTGILNLSYSYSKWLNVAVPIDQIKFILDDLKKNAEITPKYGFSIAEEAYPGGGVELTKVRRNTPARKARLRRGDVVLEVDGLAVENPEELAKELTVLPPGSEVTFLIRRSDEEMVVKLTSGKVVKERKKPEPEPEPEPEPQPVARERGTMGVRATQEKDHLVITKVAEGGAGAEAGIKVGDKLLEANGKKVKTLDELSAILKSLHAGDKIEVLIERDGWTKKIELTLKKKQ